MAKKAPPLKNPWQCWLVKTEPESFSIDDFLSAPKKTTCWDGVRNYQARNFLRDDMKLGHRVLIYHSNANPPAIVGVARVVREAYPDPTAFDPHDDHYDPASKRDHPRWMMVDLQLEQKFARPLPLPELKKLKPLQDMELLRTGSRLSVQPVGQAEFEFILKLAKK
jgi:predicted RNA-binding protein with PUA-like domain